MKYSFYLWNARVGSWELAEGGADPAVRFTVSYPCVGDDGRVWLCWPDNRNLDKMPSGDKEGVYYAG